MIILGIDPGLDGALTALHFTPDLEAPPVLLLCEPSPTVRVKKGNGTKREYLLSDLTTMVRDCVQRAGTDEPVCGFLERVSIRPGEGGVSSLRIGESGGIWRGILAMGQIPTHLVTPVVWKRRFNLLNRPKDEALLVLDGNAPNLAAAIAAKKATKAQRLGMADATLIALYGATALRLGPPAE